MGVKIREKRKKLYLDVYIDGRRRWEALGVSLTDDKTHNKQIWEFAEICKAKRELQVAEGKWGVLDHLGGKTALYVYVKKMAEGRNKQKDRIWKVLPYLEKYPGGQTIQLAQITSKWFTNFQNWLVKDSGLSPQSAFSYAFAIRMALDEAVRSNILLQNPADGVKGVIIPESDKDYLTLDELQNLAKVPIGGKLGDEVRRAFIFACYCALRISDIKTLTWGDIEHKIDGPQIVKKMVKTSHRVIVPLHESAWKIINDKTIHNKNTSVFSLIAGSKTDTNKYLLQWTEKAGIGKHITWHAARRTCPSLLHELGVDVYTIQKICGHKKIDTTAIYTKVSDQKLREAVNTLPDIQIVEAAE